MLDRTAVRRAEPVETAYDIVLDLPLAELERDPYPFYAWMREACPVVHVPETGRVWLLTWELCREAGLDDTVFGPTKEAHESVYGRPNIMSLTGEDHRTLRNAATAGIRPRPVRTYYETGIRATTRTYLEAVRPRGGADATVEIFEPIAQRVVGDVMGFHDLDDATLGRWFHVLAAYLVDYGRDPEVAVRSREVQEEIRSYVEGRLPSLIDRSDGSEGTVLGHLLHHGMPPGEVRPLSEILPTIGVLIVGGFQEPAHLIASTLHGLLTHPDQAERVRADPEQWARPAIEEGLRWLPPFGYTEKLTTQDTELGGVRIPAGTEIALVMGSANRDPARFDRPDEFDIGRPDQDNLAFGFGSHFCIGHHLARALGEVALAETFRMLPGLRLDPERPTTVDGWQTRAPKTMPVLWDA